VSIPVMWSDLSISMSQKFKASFRKVAVYSSRVVANAGETALHALSVSMVLQAALNLYNDRRDSRNKKDMNHPWPIL
jgi:hypothetical protein